MSAIEKDGGSRPPDLSAMTGGDGAGALSRRELLRGAASVGVVAGASSFLAACGSSPGTTKSPAASGKAKRGGRLRAGLLGGSSADTLEADNLVSYMDFARGFQLYDPLVFFTRDMQLQLQLAEELHPTTSAGDVWLIRLRPDVEFHNGKTLTSADVRFTLQRIVQNKFEGNPLIPTIDAHGIRLLDTRSLLVPFHQPFSIFDEALASTFFNIVPEGYDPKHPVGTGPFVFKQFTPGVTSTFTRNPRYWKDGLPYLDEVVIEDFADSTSQANGLLSSQLDVIDEVAFGAVSSLRSSGMQIVVNQGTGFNPIVMRVDVPPFDDVRVRQAMRLIINRPQSIETAMAGYAGLANDLFTPLDPDFDHALPQRHQDIPEAKSLLKAAGHSNLAVTLVASPLGAGIVETAEVFKQDALQAAVSVSLSDVPEGVFFGPSYLKWTFGVDIWSAQAYLVQVLQAMLPISPYNETHWNNKRYIDLAYQALATTNPATRRDIIHEMQTIEWNEGGYIIPYYPWPVDALRSNVRGVVPTRTGWPLNTFGFDQMWLE
jgi:peptide/nickel transport system substrate-binding protein